MTALRAVFFDLDDTLADSDSSWHGAVDASIQAAVARSSGLDEEAVRQAWGEANASLAARLDAGQLTTAQVRDERWRLTLALLGTPDDTLASELNLLLGRTYLDHLHLFEDASTLDTLRGRCHVGIITNGAADAHPDSQRSKAAHLDLLDRVDSFLASDDAGSRKPDSAIFRLALRQAGVESREAVYVGDSIENDVVGANRAGMLSVLLWRRAGEPPSGTGDARPMHVVTTLHQVPELVLGTNEERA